MMPKFGKPLPVNKNQLKILAKTTIDITGKHRIFSSKMKPGTPGANLLDYLLIRRNPQNNHI